MADPETATPLLRIDALTVEYATARGRVRALDDVSLSIPRGQALGLVGESGSGKSTVVLALLGLLGASTGITATVLVFDGHDLLRNPASVRGRRIGVVFQDPSSVLNPSLPVGLQIAEPLILHRRLGHAEAFAQATALLAETGIPDAARVMRAYPHQLSGGMKQRVVIATALAPEPDLLLLDEPTTALDVTVEAQILDLLETIRARRFLTMLLVSHNLGVVDRICDQVSVLYAGRTVEAGPTRSLLGAPRHPYTKGLLGALPIPGTRAPLVPMAGNLPDLTQKDPGCNFRPRCPIATEGCGLPQPLAAAAPSHLVRCHRTDETAALHWPVPEAARDGAPRPGGIVIEGAELRRSFRTGGAIARLRGRQHVVHAVDGVSVAIARAEILGVVGESGSGKSTLGRLLLRLLRTEAGAVRFDGYDVPDPPPLAFRRRAQIVFQNPDTALNPRQTVHAILRRPLHHFGITRTVADTAAEIDRLLDLVRLPRDYRGRYPHQLSGGEKQRVSIARALASAPEFVIADEAVSALDVSVQAAVLNLFADLRARLGVAYLFISHDIGVIAHIADRVAVMYRGTLVEQGATPDILRPPYHPYTEALLSAVPIVGAADRHAARIRLAGDAGIAASATGCRFAPRCPRRIGPVCDTVPPPWQQAAEGHAIACHIPITELAMARPVLAYAGGSTPTTT
jgi:peptide/nickel transport system ATP-binding protein